MVQPGLVVLDSRGEVLYHWAIEPSLMNVGGATDRPDISSVWAHIKQVLEDPSKKDEPPKLAHTSRMMFRDLFLPSMFAMFAKIVAHKICPCFFAKSKILSEDPPSHQEQP
mmetsp:Transcript_9619/g.20598  ORF Transcript_9619/g.20598 Transcript_9619/m.20598 type:complete len:111 (-) Transcript_9619:74-406(-)